jgi:hypothetical protein
VRLYSTLQILRLYHQVRRGESRSQYGEDLGGNGSPSTPSLPSPKYPVEYDGVFGSSGGLLGRTPRSCFASLAMTDCFGGMTPRNDGYLIILPGGQEHEHYKDGFSDLMAIMISGGGVVTGGRGAGETRGGHDGTGVGGRAEGRRNDYSGNPAISEDGNYAAFSSGATNLWG